MRRNIVALLESMWGWGGYNTPGEDAPRHFRINPINFSGRRLYRICAGTNHSLLVTNCCRTVQASANHHGKPDPAWVLENLRFLKSEGMDLLLVCGKVARETYEKALAVNFFGTELLSVPTIYMDHPAARRWSNASLDAMNARITGMLQ